MAATRRKATAGTQRRKSPTPPKAQVAPPVSADVVLLDTVLKSAATATNYVNSVVLRTVPVDVVGTITVADFVTSMDTVASFCDAHTRHGWATMIYDCKEDVLTGLRKEHPSGVWMPSPRDKRDFEDVMMLMERLVRWAKVLKIWETSNA